MKRASSTEGRADRCPFCGAKRYAIGHRLYRCSKCDGLSDDEPSEGGDYSNRPDGRLIHQEALEQRKKQREMQRRRTQH